MKDERPIDLKLRTKQLALRIIRLFSALPKDTPAQVIGRQVLRSGTSVGAHYREGVRARSSAEFVSKLQGGLQELEETAYWLELLSESGTMSSERLAALIDEVDQLTAILTVVVKNVKRRGKQ